ncbi:hypothetical protein [Candidatus Mycoplasma haematominutum]|nr:hypothetical protein [Candidatus Mycoplasma haematominutum]
MTILLAAPSSTALTTLELGNFSLGNLMASGGGSHHLENKYPERTAQTLELEGAAKNLQLNKSEGKVQDYKLKESSTVDIDLTDKQSVSDLTEGDTIKTIYLEEHREGEVLSLSEEGREKAQSIITESIPHSRDYFAAREKVNAFFKSQQVSASRRSRRSATEKSKVITLTQHERKAILEMLKLFEKLEKEKANLTPKVNKLDNSTLPLTQTSFRPSLSEIEQNLLQIGWTFQPQVKYEENSSRWSRSSTPRRWANWEHNPYHVFLSSKQDYDSLIRKIQTTQSSLQAQKNKDMLTGGLRRRMILSPEAKKIEAQVEEAKSRIAMKVAAKMLIWLNQFETPSI